MKNLRDRLYECYVRTHFGTLRTLDSDAFESYRRHYAVVYRPLLPANRDARILEIGCGLGQFLNYLKTEGFTNYWGIDIGTEQIEYCRQYVTPQVSCVPDTSSFLGDRIGQFDTIVMLDVLEHLENDELWLILAAVKEALIPGGSLIVSVPNAACLTSLVTRYGDLTHCRLFTEGSLSQLFRAIGFSEVDMRPNEKKVIHSFRSRRERWLWKLRDRFVRWVMAEFYQHVMEGAIPRIQTINLIGVGRKPVESDERASAQMRV